MAHNDNQPGFIPRPADVFGILPGVNSHELQDTAESATDGVATGTPPAIGSGGLLKSASVTQKIGGIVGSFGLQNTSVGQELADLGNAGAGGFQPDGGGDGLDIPWMQLGVFALLLIAVNAFAGGAGEALVE